MAMELAPFTGVIPGMVTRYRITVTLAIGLAHAISLLPEARAQMARWFPCRKYRFFSRVISQPRICVPKK